MKPLLVWSFAALALLALAPAAGAALRVGDKAPLFEGKDQDGNEWKLEDKVGKKAVLLYFYPKDGTPGCTRQARGLCDMTPTLAKLDVEIVGVSFDDAESHKKFIANNKIKYTLLADTEGKIADLYGARSGGSKMANRVTYLINKEGIVNYVTDSPDPERQMVEIQLAVQQMEKR